MTVVEIDADLFRRLAAENPQAIEQIGVAAMARRADLERIRTATAGAVTVETNTLLARMKKFLRLSGWSADAPSSAYPVFSASPATQLAIRALVPFLESASVLHPIRFPRSVVIVVVAIARAIPFLAGVVGILAVPRVVAALLVAVVHAVLERVAPAVAVQSAAVAAYPRISTR